MYDRTSIASWNLVADGVDCGFKISNAVADTVKDQFEWTTDFLTVRSASDLVGVWLQHSAKQALKSIGQWQTARGLHRRIFNDYVDLWRAVGLLPPSVASAVSVQKPDVLSPEREVLLLHIME